MRSQTELLPEMFMVWILLYSIPGRARRSTLYIIFHPNNRKRSCLFWSMRARRE